MAITISESFQILKSNLEILDMQKLTVCTRQAEISEAIGARTSVLKSFLSGSYTRNTLITPLNGADIDIFIVLDSKYFTYYNDKNDGPSRLLDLVKQTITSTYTKTHGINKNGQAVSIQFTDFMVDVVPSFCRAGGGFLIPNSITQSWLSTDPTKHVDILKAANAWNNGNLVPLIRMIKAWNKTHGSYFSSFHLEVIALSVFQDVTIFDFPSGINYYFEKGRFLVQQKNPDPAGYHDDVGDYINSREKQEIAVNRFNTGLSLALRAKDLANRGRVQEAITEWRKVFGVYFPIYG